MADDEQVDEHVLGENRWWYLAAALIMAIALAAFYVGIKAFPQSTGGYVLPGALVTVLLAAGAGYRVKVLNSRMARHERTALIAAAALSVVTILLHQFAVPDGLSVWTVLTGVLPALPFVVLAWRSQR